MRLVENPRRTALPTAIPLEKSPLSSKFQHMEQSAFDNLAADFNAAYLEKGVYPQITFPGVPKVFAPRIFVCVNYEDAKKLLIEGDVNQNDIRGLQVNVPAGTDSRAKQILMTSANGFLSKLFTYLGVPREYKNLAELFEHIPFITAKGPRHTELYLEHAFTARRNMMDEYDYEGSLEKGMGSYLDNLKNQADGQGRLSGNIAELTKRTVIAGAAELLGLPFDDLYSIYSEAKLIDKSVEPLPPPNELKEADNAVGRAINLLSEIVTSHRLTQNGLLQRELERITIDKNRTIKEWAYFALMHIRVSIENPIDSVNLALRFLSRMNKDERARWSADVPALVRHLFITDPPVGFVLRYLNKNYRLETPTGKAVKLKRRDSVVISPRLLQSKNLTLNSGDNITTFGGGGRRCPGEPVGTLIVNKGLEQIVSRFEIEEYPDTVETSDSGFFRRITYAYGVMGVKPK